MSEHQTRRIGKGMMIAGWVLFLGLLAMFFNKVLENQHNPNQELDSRITNDGAREVTLTRNRQGHYVTTGIINNAKVVFLLDTGATNISIPESVAFRLGLKRGAAVQVSTANGSIKVYQTKLKRVQLGQISVNNLVASINPYMEGEEILLGMNFLKKLELVQRGKTLTLRQYSR